MKIEQVKLSRMQTFCYLIKDEISGHCALIDPAFDVPQVLKKAGAGGYTITYVINTHHHPDHSAGNAEVIRQTGARLCIHVQDAQALGKIAARAFARVLGGKGSPRPAKLLQDGDKIRIGATILTYFAYAGAYPRRYLPLHARPCVHRRYAVRRGRWQNRSARRQCGTAFGVHSHQNLYTAGRHDRLAGA